MMNERTIKILEFNKILEKVTAHAASQPAKEKVRALLPMTDIYDIEKAQQETADALKRIYKGGKASFFGLRDLRPVIMRLELKAALSQKELLDLASGIDIAARVKAYGGEPSEEEGPDSLQELFDGIEVLSHLSAEIKRCIISEDEMADDASSALKEIRRKMKNAGEKIKTELNRILARETAAGNLQESIVTSRGGRYVIPVKAASRGKINGLVHDQSASGSTVFIEPMAIVELNNEIREWEIKETEEINRILKMLSVEASQYSEELKYNQDILTELDFIFARAMYAKEIEGTRPVFNNERRIVLKKARHPLIDPKKVVPIDIELGTDFRMLIITGPNTGGKTVSLKTTGLLCLMGQAGLHIPAFDNSELPVFEDIFADIGDEQSIEQSLSTFSSHMTQIVKIIKGSSKGTLVLLDELCSGTDPVEGAALAMAVLKNMLIREVSTMATTHYSELKVFALSTKGVSNASCEFDVDTLSPTYRLLIGVPGKSNAFAIASKLGLPEFIINDAKRRLDAEDVRLEDVLAELEAKRTAIEKEKEAAEEARREAEELKNKLQAQQDKIKEQKEKILAQAREEAADVIKEAKEEADYAIKQINKLGGGNSREMEKIRSGLRQKADKYSGGKKLQTERKGKILTEDDAVMGTAVRVISMNTTGRIVSKPNRNGEVEVQMGILRSKVKLSDLELVDDVVITGPTIEKSD
ncbi:MAG: endonuclease MutS2, partial [Lachnospiraceae bacterium]|nr:endonuclease MutS2 [Lachnospiraceae bacterium]